MGRFIVLFLVVGAVAMFMLVLNTPPQVIRDSYIYQRYVAPPTERVAEVEKEPVAKPAAPRRTVARTTRQVEVTSAAPENSAAGELLAAPHIEANNPPATRAEDVVSVSKDALIYSSNSTSAPVLKVLNKGQVVEVDMEFITPGGKWALVTIPNEQISGFVRTDGLVLTSPNTNPPAPAAPESAQ